MPVTGSDTPPPMAVIGSTNTDLVMQTTHLPLPGETVGDGKFSQLLGGKGANQAVAAARSNGTVRFISCVGEDDYGTAAVNALAAEGIDVSGIQRSIDAATGTALIFVDQRGENCIGVAPGANHAIDAQQILSQLKGAMLYLMQLELPLPVVETVLNYAYQNGVHTVLNAAPMMRLSQKMLSKVTTLVVNSTELRQLCGHLQIPMSSPEQACARIGQLGVWNVLVTLGDRGVYVHTSKEQMHLPAFEVDVVDTTGAGDTFCGALATQLVFRRPLEMAVTYAQKAAALAVTQLGAQTAIPHQSEILAFEP